MGQTASAADLMFFRSSATRNWIRALNNNQPKNFTFDSAKYPDEVVNLFFKNCDM
jgi:hypothetical protein